MAVRVNISEHMANKGVILQEIILDYFKILFVIKKEDQSMAHLWPIYGSSMAHLWFNKWAVGPNSSCPFHQRLVLGLERVIFVL